MLNYRQPHPASRFGSKDTPDFHEEVARLTGMPKGDAIACAAMAAKLEQIDTKTFGERVEGSWWALLATPDGPRPRLGGKFGYVVNSRLPLDEHGELRQKGRAFTYISHPRKLTREDFDAINTACAKYGLHAQVDGSSLYLPCGTVRIVWTKDKAAVVHKPEFADHLRAQRGSKRSKIELINPSIDGYVESPVFRAVKSAKKKIVKRASR